MIAFFACPRGIWEDIGVCKSDFKIYLPTGFDILDIHCRQPTHVQCMNLFAVRFQFLCCCTDGLGGPTLAGTSRDIYFPIYLPRAVVECMILFTHGVSLHLPVQTHVSNVLCHWVQHLALGMCTLCYPRCAIVFSFSNLLKYTTILRFTTVCAKNPMKSTYSEKVPAKRVPMVF